MTNNNDLPAKVNTNANLVPEAEPSSMHPLVAAAVNKSGEINPETLDKLLDVQQKWEANEARKAYAAAMALFREICPPIFKDARVHFENSGGGSTDYQHETLAGVLNTISDALGETGLNPTFRTEQLEGGRIRVTCRVTHKNGHFEETSLEGSPDSSGKKNNIQQVGSTITYLQRYTLKAILGLAAAVDNDGAGAESEIVFITEEQAIDLKQQLEKLDEELPGFSGAFFAYLESMNIPSVEQIADFNYEKVIAKMNQSAAFRRDKMKDSSE